MFSQVILNLVVGFSIAVPSLAFPARGEVAAHEEVSPSAPGFARYVPASARLFITVRRLGEIDAALDRAHAWRLLAVLIDGSAEGARSFDLPQAIASLLGLPSSIDGEEWKQSEIGLVASSEPQLAGAVWFVRIPDDAVLTRWFPSSQRIASGSIGPVHFFQMEAGVMVYVRDGIVAMARRWGSGSLLEKTANLMAGRGGEGLDRSKVFRELMAYLPADYLALGYLARNNPGAEGSVSAGESSLWWPAIDRAVVGLYEGEGRIDVAIRASLASPHPRPKLAPTAIERLLRLPHTTLFASATTIDFDQSREAVRQRPPAGTLGRYLAFLAALQKTPGEPDKKKIPLGPHVIPVWGQDLSEGPGAPGPQVALLVESRCAGTDELAVREYVREMAEGIVQWVQALALAQDPGAPGLTIRESRHLGVTILHIPLDTYAGKSQFPLARLLRNTNPAWTVWNGWLILALHREHIERILEAQYGLVPTLATVRDVEVLRKRATDWSVISIIQADLATDVLDQWLAAYEAGSPSLLDPVWWRGRSRAGVSMPSAWVDSLQLVEEPGVVVVSRVDPNTAFLGRLEPGDRIVGIDGQLLSLVSPKADLQRRWVESTVKPGPTLRVQRSGLSVDVIVPQNKTDALLSGIRIDPAGAVRELASLGRTLEFGSFAVNVSDERHYSARLSLRFSTARPDAPGSTDR